MKKLAVIVALLAVMFMVFALSSCDITNDKSNTTTTTTTTSTKPEATTIPEKKTTTTTTTTKAPDVPPVPETPKTLSSDGAALLFDKAMVKASPKTEFTSVYDIKGKSTLSALDIKQTVRQCGNDYTFIMPNGTVVILVGDRCYIRTADAKVMFKPTADEREYLLGEYSSSVTNGEVFSSAFTGWSGMQYKDGRAELAASGMSDKFALELAEATEIDNFENATVNAASFKCSVNSKGFPVTMEIDLSIGLEDKGKIEFSVIMNNDFGSNSKVVAPDDAILYVETKFRTIFGGEVFPKTYATTLGLCPGLDDYYLEMNGPEKLKAQCDFLAVYGNEYVGKTFIMASAIGIDTVGEVSVPYIYTLDGDDVIKIYLSFPEGTECPAVGTNVGIKAELVPVIDEAENIIGYIYSVKDIRTGDNPLGDPLPHTQIDDIVIAKEDVVYLCVREYYGSARFSVPKGTALRRNTFNEEWSTVIYNDACYFVRTSDIYIRPEEQKLDIPITMYILASSLNVRSTPDFGSTTNKVGILNAGDAVEVIAYRYVNDTKYNVIMFQGKKCYITNNMNYITDERPD